MSRLMKINDIVKLFSLDKNKERFETIIKKIAESCGIKYWDSFKKTKRKSQYYAKNMNKVIDIYGNKKEKDSYFWTCEEIEYCIQKELTTKQIQKTDKVKEMFEGFIITK